MGLHTFWQNNKVLIVMIPGLALMHLGWYQIKNSPLLHSEKRDYIPEPAIATYVLNKSAASSSPTTDPPPASAAATKSN